MKHNPRLLMPRQFEAFVCDSRADLVRIACGCHDSAANDAERILAVFQLVYNTKCSVDTKAR